MQSSFNVIKYTSVKDIGPKEIVTDSELPSIKIENENNCRNHIESYENLAKTMIENARRQGETILAKAYEEARNIEEEALVRAREAYENAYSEGRQEGYNIAYTEGMQKAKKEGDEIISSAEGMLKAAKAEYENYLQSKVTEINELILTIARSVLGKEVEDRDSINGMIFNALEVSKSSRSFIIRCNGIYVEELRTQVDSWKEQLGFLGDIFIVKDDSIEKGNAIIDKGNGKVVVGVKLALEKIKAVLEGKE